MKPEIVQYVLFNGERFELNDYVKITYEYGLVEEGFLQINQFYTPLMNWAGDDSIYVRKIPPHDHSHYIGNFIKGEIISVERINKEIN